MYHVKGMFIDNSASAKELVVPGSGCLRIRGPATHRSAAHRERLRNFRESNESG